MKVYFQIKILFLSTYIILAPTVRTNAQFLSYGQTIGQTYYDLQSNASHRNAIVRHADGTVSVVWTQSLTNFTQPISGDRGVGYNYFDGSTWMYGAQGECSTTHGCASAYSGWPAIVGLSGGKEYVMTHYNGTTVGGLSKISRTTKGAGVWSATSSLGIDSIYDMNSSSYVKTATWPRAVSVGDTIHALAAFGGNPMDNKGVIGNMRYYRSSDGGLTWDIANYALPYDTNDNIYRVNGDGYNITARGSIVAITVGTWAGKWLLLKSTDGGVTWTKKIIKDYTTGSTFLANAGSYDFYESNTYDFSLLIDNAGDVHVFSGGLVVGVPAGEMPNGKNATVYYPLADVGIYYWNENISNPKIIARAIIDIKNIDPSFNSTDTTYDVANGIPLYYLGATSMPTAAVDQSGNLYCIYSSMVEGTSNTGDTLGQSYRDLYLVSSVDSGATWTSPANIADQYGGQSNGTPFEEEIHPVVYPYIGNDNILHLSWQGDYEPGRHVAGDTDPVSINYINYLGLPVQGACIIGLPFASDTSICGQQNLTLQVIPGNGANSCKWYATDTGAVAIYTGTTYSVFVNTTKTYFVSSFDTVSGCESILRVPVSITYSSFPNVVISPVDTSICEGSSVFISAAGGVSYSWNNGLSNSASHTVSPSNTTLYTVTVLDTTGCSVDTGLIIYVLSSPTPVISWTGTELLSNYSFGNQWFLSGVKIVGAVDSTYRPTLNGNYHVEVTDSSGCVGHSSIFTFSNAGGGTTGLSLNADDELFRVFPNPTTGILNIVMKQSAVTTKSINIQILDQVGQNVTSIDSREQTKIQIDVSNLGNGMYTLVLNSEHGKKYSMFILSNY